MSASRPSPRLGLKSPPTAEPAPKRAKPAGPPVALTAELVEWMPTVRGQLRGFAAVRIPEIGIRVDGVAVWKERGSDGWGVMLPGRALLDESRELRRDENGKVIYGRTISFTTVTARKSFEAAVIAVLRPQLERLEAEIGG
jgi:hypothetical protein